MLFILYTTVPAPCVPMIQSINSTNSTTVEIVWMKGCESAIVYNVTIQYIYQGLCNCSNVNMEQCQMITVIGTSNDTYNYTISSLQEHSEYRFLVIAENPAGSSTPADRFFTTLSASKLLWKHLSLLHLLSNITVYIQCSSKWSTRVFSCHGNQFDLNYSPVDGSRVFSTEQ